VGRSGELSALSSRASDARKGRAQVVLIEGDAGYGKTELVRHFLRQSCDDFVIIRAEAEELAADVTLYLLGQLGVPTSDGPFAAGMELVDRLAEQQDLGPVALVIEDLHWADPASQDALLLAARRLREDRVLVIATARPDAARSAAWERFMLSDERGWPRACIPR
jgi:predicted ATPase